MGSGSSVPAVLNSTNLVDIGRSFLGMGQSTMRDGACQRSPSVAAQPSHPQRHLTSANGSVRGASGARQVSLGAGSAGSVAASPQAEVAGGHSVNADEQRDEPERPENILGHCFLPNRPLLSRVVGNVRSQPRSVTRDPARPSPLHESLKGECVLASFSPLRYPGRMTEPDPE